MKKEINYKKIKYKPRNLVDSKYEVFLSILIPAYNAEKTIEKCIDSILSQKTKYSYEVIVVNDGSNDNTEKILYGYNNKIKIISQNNKGIGVTRNVLLKNAKGKYISFLDADDCFQGDFIQLMLEKAENEKLDYVKCNYRKVNFKDMNKIYESTYKENEKFKELDGYLWGSIIKKDIYIGISFPENYWFEDMINSLLVFPKIKKHGIINQTLYIYFDYPLSASKIQGKARNIKNLDQLYLVEEIVDDFISKKQNIDLDIYSRIKRELSIMLFFRTRKLEKKIRKFCFSYSKEILERIELFEKDKSFLAKIYRNNLYYFWIIYCFYSKLLEKINIIK